MKIISQTVLAFLGLLFLSPAMAQDSGNDQADVWATVETQWNAEESGDKKWVDTLLAEDFVGWDKSSPAPQNKSSVRMWNRVLENSGKMKGHELFPLSIIVHDDVAIAHYLFSSATEQKDGELKVVNGRFTDVLVRSDDGWKFLSWHGGENDE